MGQCYSAQVAQNSPVSVAFKHHDGVSKDGSKPTRRFLHLVSRNGPPPPLNGSDQGSQPPHRAPCRDSQESCLSSDSYASYDSSETGDAELVQGGGPSSKPPQVATDAEEVADLVTQIHVGPLAGRCGRSPLYNGVWRQQRVSVMVCEHLVASDTDVDRLKCLMVAAATSPALQHPHLVRVRCCAVQCTPTEGAADADDGSVAGSWDEAGPEIWARKLVTTWTVMEHCKLGNLADAIEHYSLREWPAADAPPKLDHILLTSRELAIALADMHAHGTSQPLFNSSRVNLACKGLDSDPRCFTAKICTASHFCFERSPFSCDKLAWQEMPYVAPEVQMEGEDRSPASNAWAFGVVLWEMLAGRLAWKELCFSQMMRAMLNKNAMLPELGPECPSLLQALVNACLDPDPCLRPDFRTILSRLQEVQQNLSF